MSFPRASATAHPCLAPPRPPFGQTANPLLRLSNNSTQKHSDRAQHKHLDHTNEFYFLTADRRTRWMAGANLPPFLLPPPIATYNPCRGHRERERQSLGQFEGGIKQRDRSRNMCMLVKIGLILSPWNERFPPIG